MTTCRECGKAVSDEAASCPHCGVAAPSERPKEDNEEGNFLTQKVGTWRSMLVVVVLVIVGAFIAGHLDEWFGSSSAQEAAAKAECRQDLSCWAKENQVGAAVNCKPLIERRAKYDSKWTDGIGIPTFSRIRWINKEKGTITYFGDRVKFQNGFGVWQNYRYACDFNPNGDVVIAVRVNPGSA